MLARSGAFGCLALAAVLCALPAHAQSREEQDRRARIEFSAGREAFTHGNFEEAARRFEEAYRLSQRAQLLYNIGTTYDRLHRWREARDAFSRYLEAFPNAAERDEVRARLAVIEQEIQREEQASRAPQVVVVHDATPRVIVRTVPSESRPFLVAGGIVGGLGVIAGIVSLTVGLLTNQVYDGLVMTCGNTPRGCPQPSIDDINLRATITNTFMGVAGVLVAGAVVLFILDWRRPRPQPTATGRIRVAPMLSTNAANAPDGAFLVVAGTF